MAQSGPSVWRPQLVQNLEGDVLEIGVGTGENLGYYRRARHLHAVEPDAGRADQARAAALHAHVPVTVDVAPAESLPYEDGSFDHVVSSLVFCSVDQPVAALREIERVLRPQGVLHLVEHVRPENPLFGPLFGAITPLWSRLAWNCHLDRRTIETLRAEGWQVELLERRYAIFVRLRALPPRRRASNPTSIPV